MMDDKHPSRIELAVRTAILIEQEIMQQARPGETAEDIRNRVSAASRVYAALLIAEPQPC